LRAGLYQFARLAAFGALATLVGCGCSDGGADPDSFDWDDPTALRSRIEPGMSQEGATRVEHHLAKRDFKGFLHGIEAIRLEGDRLEILVGEVPDEEHNHLTGVVLTFQPPRAPVAEAFAYSLGFSPGDSNADPYGRFLIDDGEVVVNTDGAAFGSPGGPDLMVEYKFSGLWGGSDCERTGKLLIPASELAR
jgi:hypothetical protein